MAKSKLTPEEKLLIRCGYLFRKWVKRKGHKVNKMQHLGKYRGYGESVNKLGCVHHWDVYLVPYYISACEGSYPVGWESYLASNLKPEQKQMIPYLETTYL